MGYQSDSGWVADTLIYGPVYVVEGDPIEDIYYGTPIDNLPTRPSTIASVYQFGTIEYNTYSIYSGWTDRNDMNAEPLSRRQPPYTA